MTTESEYVSTALIDSILVITLNRPEKKNALTPCMYWALVHTLHSAEGDDGIHVVMITNNGDYFCAGNDVSTFAALANTPYQDRPGFNFMMTLSAFNKPLVAAVNGSAVGLGVTLLLHCDLVCASTTARLSFPFVTIGLVPEFGSTALLPQRLGYQKAAEILLLGKKLEAADALKLGLFNTLAAGEQVYEQALAHCKALAMQPREAVLATKQLMKGNEVDTIQHRIDAETQAINRLLPHLRLPKKA
ncbi:MAG TPA: enoyl-CoA hydratase [Haliea salexigens]|uniref:Enoyl-CoA hydratase n=1 Tax=Haliea salexigens TaxID=287487 RepID=A0A3C1KQN5_9GAMM|nr:enoyl-CoA hydratase [Haliea sp.]HAN29029.1 enoyl-CoA hydratase [Haliea salexigens]|tara:strand:+ start:1463 stop:2200 length:738 start_codon:yes stop_codon:yes gene_type:complete